MFIGNGLALPLVARQRAGGFSPLSLFTSGAKGAWYDPSDYSTLFQDSAGTTPVTAVEQPVGLMLDKSQGLVLGSELNDGLDVLANWTVFGTNTITQDGDAIKITYVSNAFGAYSLFQAAKGLSTNLTVGQWYKVTGQAKVNSGSANVTINTASVWTSSAITSTTYVDFTIYFLCDNATTNYIAASNLQTGEELWIRGVSVKSFAGNHASQSTAASRPVLRCRYNLLTYSEQFDNAAWAKSNATITANSVVAPDGTTTADLVTATNAADATCNQSVSGINAVGRVFTFTFYARCASGTVTLPVLGDDQSGKFWSNPNTNKVTVTTEWQMFTVTGTAPALSGSNLRVGFGGFSSWLTGDAVYIWGADLRTGSSAGTYQRIAAATDYATAGFLPYLDLITDDSLSTGSIDFTATDKMFIGAGVTKNSDSAQTAIVGLGNFGAVTGAFEIGGSSGAAGNYLAGVRGSLNNAAWTYSTYNAPITNVLAFSFDLAATPTSAKATGKINGVTVSGTFSLADAGTGNFSTNPLFIGRRNNTSFPFNGRIYQLIVCGKTLTAAEIASTEAFVNTKTGAY